MSSSIQNQSLGQSSSAQSDAQGIPHKDKSSSSREMSRRVKDNCRALLDNFTEIIRLSKVSAMIELSKLYIYTVPVTYLG